VDSEKKMPKRNRSKKISNEMPYRRDLLTLIKAVATRPCARLFLRPVDPKALGIEDYFDVIKHPMDIGTVRRKLERNEYKTPEAVA
jgi:hypothetical protein